MLFVSVLCGSDLFTGVHVCVLCGVRVCCVCMCGVVGVFAFLMWCVF